MTIYEIYRQNRPWKFFDSKVVRKAELTKKVFQYQMDRLSADMKQDQFENLTCSIALRFVTPNLIPQTGPTGGGDGKTDMETYPVADEIAEKWYVADGGCRGCEKWAVAISCREDWDVKVKNDVANIVQLNRGFTRIFFSNRLIKSRDSKRYEDDLEKKWNSCHNLTTQIPNLTTSLYLAKLQEKYNNFKLDKFDTSYVKMVDEMMFAFTGINTDLSFLFMNSADENGTLTWHGNYSPSFFDRRFISQLRGCICEIAIKEHEKGGEISSQMHDIARSLLMNYLYQCGYLAFWSCLADMATFPGNTLQEKEVLDNLATYLLDNYANIYIYNLSVENNPLGGCEHIDKRGSAENSPRPTGDGI